VVFERQAFKESNETLFLQVADSGAVDLRRGADGFWD